MIATILLLIEVPVHVLDFASSVAKSNTIAMKAGTLLLSGLPVYVLFDSRATNSFIFASFVAKFDITCVKKDNTLEVAPFRKNPLHKSDD